MSCEKPLLAVNYGLDASTGKHHIKVVKYRPGMTIADYEELYGDNLLLLPCGRCPSCKEKRLKDWAVRCELESRYYKDNCFVTLTYREDSLPKGLVKKDFQKFIKDLRNSGVSVRYFGCGELSPSGRPHYHLCLFGYFPDDARFSHMSKSKEHIFKSKFLDNIWSKGIVAVQYFSPRTAGYCAGYTLKEKNTGFILMSKRPGIGERYIKENAEKVYKNDSIVCNFGVSGVPRYFDKMLEHFGYDISLNKITRLTNSGLNLALSMCDRKIPLKEQIYQLNGVIKNNQLSRLRRSFNG